MWTAAATVKMELNIIAIAQVAQQAIHLAVHLGIPVLVHRAFAAQDAKTAIAQISIIKALWQTEKINTQIIVSLNPQEGPIKLLNIHAILNTV